MAGQDAKDQKAETVSSTFVKPLRASASNSHAVSKVARSAEDERRQSINSTLVSSAREAFNAAADRPPTGYSRQLQQLQNNVNAYLKRNPSFHGQVIILKPEEYDKALALGMKPRDAIQALLKREGIEADANMLTSMASHMTSTYDSKFGLSGYTQDAETQPNVGTGANRAYVIIPNSSHADPNPVKGLSYADNIDFFNRHETWHAKDSWYDMDRFSAKAKAASLEWNAEALSATAENREAFAMQMRKEALGDIAAVGDMIREGKPLGMIDAVATWRAGDPFDVQHLSTPVLEGLKAEIGKKGLDNFRKMNEKQVRQFYHDVVEKYGMSATAVQKALQLETANDAMHAKMASSPDPDTAKAMRFLKMKNADPAPEDSDVPLTPAQEKVKTDLDKYSPRQALEKKAIALHHKVTPETMMDAYDKLMEDLRQKALKEPNNELYPLQMTKLQETFVDILKTADYVAINRRNKLPAIEEVEPSLSNFVVKPPAGEPAAAPLETADTTAKRGPIPPKPAAP